MSEEVNNKVAIATDDLEWARSVFDFAWGRSTLAQRLKALELLVGSQAEVIRLAGLAASTYKSVITREGDMASERIGALARGTGLSLAYLVYGSPETARDTACEEKRFDIAVREFAIPATPSRREARLLVVAEARTRLDDELGQLTAMTQLADAATAFPTPPPPGYLLVAPLRPTVHSSGRGYYSTAEPAPIALAQAWLDERRLSSERLRYLGITGDEGGAMLAAGAVALIDVGDCSPRTGVVFAMDVGGELQLRRIVSRLAGGLELVHINPAWPNEPFAGPIGEVPVLGRLSFCFGGV